MSVYSAIMYGGYIPSYSKLTIEKKLLTSIQVQHNTGLISLATSHSDIQCIESLWAIRHYVMRLCVIHRYTLNNIAPPLYINQAERVIVCSS